LIEVEMPPTYRRYFEELEDKLNQLYEVAKKAGPKAWTPPWSPSPRSPSTSLNA